MPVSQHDADVRASPGGTKPGQSNELDRGRETMSRATAPHIAFRQGVLLIAVVCWAAGCAINPIPTPSGPGEYADTAGGGAGAADGQVSLRLDAPSGSASITAGDATSIDLNGRDATITLAGKATESVTVASGATLPILKTADDALSLFASNGAGRVVLGSGEAGQIRLTGGTDGMRPAVDILAADRTRIASLTATAHGLGMLAVADASGAPVGLLHAAGTGRGRLTVRGRGGSAVATAASDGTPEFALLTADGHTTAALAATPRGGALNLMNAEGTPVVLAGITADGPGGAAAFQNGSGVTVVAAGSTKDDTGRVVVTE